MIWNVKNTTIQLDTLPHGVWWIEAHHDNRFGDHKLSICLVKWWVDFYWGECKTGVGRKSSWWTYGLTIQPAPSNMGYVHYFSGCLHRWSFETAFKKRKSRWTTQSRDTSSSVD